MSKTVPGLLKLPVDVRYTIYNLLSVKVDQATLDIVSAGREDTGVQDRQKYRDIVVGASALLLASREIYYDAFHVLRAVVVLGQPGSKSLPLALVNCDMNYGCGSMKQARETRSLSTDKILTVSRNLFRTVQHLEIKRIVAREVDLNDEDIGLTCVLKLLKHASCIRTLRIKELRVHITERNDIEKLAGWVYMMQRVQLIQKRLTLQRFRFAWQWALASMAGNHSWGLSEGIHGFDHSELLGADWQLARRYGQRSKPRWVDVQLKRKTEKTPAFHLPGVPSPYL